ncbi:MAG: 4Fe-4S dicluster domain-containing protein [Dehalococcoidia bacterium]|nr:4Fe-4S dicluster domain-containing protein [Dehalococcoidia bacterium]
MHKESTSQAAPVASTELKVIPQARSDFRAWVEKQSGENVSRCYQCGKCTAGCPVAYRMDLGPRRVIRSVQLGLKDEALKSNAIWFCVSCLTCSARCPREIDIARVMESVRLLAVREGIKPAEEQINLFHKLFLDNIKALGRINELLLGGLYNLKSGHLTQDLPLFLQMVPRGKISFVPRRAPGTAELGAIFERVRALRAQEGNK